MIVSARTSARVRPVARAVVLAGLDVIMTLRAAVMLAFVELLLRVVSLTRLGRLLGCPVDLTPAGGDRTPIEWSELSRSNRRRLRCAHRVAARWPFSDGPCLRRSLVGGHLVRRLRPTVRLGLIPTDGDVGAHSWLEIAGRPLEDIADYLPFERTVRRVT